MIDSFPQAAASNNVTFNSNERWCVLDKRRGSEKYGPRSVATGVETECTRDGFFLRWSWRDADMRRESFGLGTRGIISMR